MFTMENKQVFRVNETIDVYQDFTHKNKSLIEKIEELRYIDDAIVKLFEGTIIEEKEEGELVSTFTDEFTSFKADKRRLLNEVEERCEESVTELEDVVNQMNHQEMTVIFQKTISGN